MATVTFTKVYGFIENLAEGVHNLGSNQLAVALSNTAPAAEADDPTVLTANAILSKVTQVSYANLSSRNLTTSTSAQSAGTYTLDLADLVLTASGAVATWRYIYIYNDTATNDNLIAYGDYGSAVTLADTNTVTITFNVSGLLTIA
jgi:hypothetical protein